jgi:lysophospholipase L1-like esterase
MEWKTIHSIFSVCLFPGRKRTTMRKMSVHRHAKEKILRLLLRLFSLLFFLLAISNVDGFVQIIMTSKPLTQIPVPYFPISCFFIAIAILLFDRWLPAKPTWQTWATQNAVLNTLLVLLSVSMPITILELGLRPFCTFVQKDADLFQRDAQLGWKLKPNTPGNAEENTWINSYGMRGPERSPYKPERSIRILFLGDSITYGLRLQDQDCYPQHTEKLLHDRGYASVECLNAGVPGYSTWQEFLYYDAHLQPYQPDIVVLSFCLNDVLNTYTGINYGDYGKNDPVPYIEDNWIDYIRRRSSILKMGNHIYYQLLYGRTQQEDAIYREGLDVLSLQEKAHYPEIIEAWEETNRFVQKIAQTAHSQNAKFLLVVFPFLFTDQNLVRTAWSPPPLLNFANEQHYPTLDMLPIIQQDMERANLSDFDTVFMDDCHPTARTSRLAAQSIVQEILSRDWLTAK